MSELKIATVSSVSGENLYLQYPAASSASSLGVKHGKLTFSAGDTAVCAEIDGQTVALVPLGTGSAESKKIKVVRYHYTTPVIAGQTKKYTISLPSYTGYTACGVLGYKRTAGDSLIFLQSYVAVSSFVIELYNYSNTTQYAEYDFYLLYVLTSELDS